MSHFPVTLQAVVTTPLVTICHIDGRNCDRCIFKFKFPRTCLKNVDGVFEIGCPGLQLTIQLLCHNWYITT